MVITDELWICAAGLGGASLIGSGLGLIIRKIPHRLNDIFLGFCAGMMITASIVCLLAPAVDLVRPASWWQVIVGLAVGVFVMTVLDRVVPHLHHLAGIYDDPDRAGANHDGSATATLNGVLLFVIAITIHKLPEGMATGVAFDDSNGADGIAMAVTIALQNIPEGMVVVTPLLMVGVSIWRTIMAALIIALVEVGGVYIGYALGSISSVALPMLLSMAAGAMLYVISDEMIPETHAHGFHRQATFALVAGVACMLFIEQLA